ncbi:fimbrial biogenesis chaperone [Marinobacter sp. F4206]|uniref:fimbrial biogenesis chaperone n=1 Tax=Marinobacter sp. F4206 TaxID=2861777 RepID=UPI001C5DA4DD|nr:fimbria/pilus periplasmic chaperone [Marinobacter sp. F4206]MBW4936623.1 fimbria/pilus periplasmic chaperone [Marinobacter sp. F4206]
MLKTRRVFCALVACFVAGLMLSSEVVAFQLVPTVSVLELPQDASGITVVVENPRTVPLPVEFELVERTVNLDGSEEYTPADEEFLVFPPQAVIGPGKSQAVRVQWVSDYPSESRSFTLFASEIPVDLEDVGKPMLQTLFRMGASIHVTPSSAQPDVTLTEASKTESGMELTLENIGDRFIYLNDVRLEFDDRMYTGSELANIVGRTLLPPARKRTIIIPEETGIPRISIN